MYNINHANIKDWAKNYDGEPFDAILCDPPYELGFMGKSWDSSGIAFDTEMWADLFRILKPGGHLLAFSGSRTYHRMAVAIEDAGFEIRDMIEWVYGSGFPKSLNIGKAVDKLQGNEREKVGTKDLKRGSSIAAQTTDNSVTGWNKPDYPSIVDITKGTSEWEGYGTALKPAHEPCVLARKPLDKGMTVAGNVLKHGTGGLNIDGSRVGAESITSHGYKGDSYSQSYKEKGTRPELTEYKQTTGRFPANLIHDGSDEVTELFPRAKGGAYPAKRGKAVATSFASGQETEGGFRAMGDDGSAARFFYCAKAGKSERNAGLEGFEAKGKVFNGQSDTQAGNAEGSVEDKFSTQPSANHHPTVKPLSLTKYLATLIKPPTGGRLLVPFSGSGSEMIGALQAGWEYVEGVELTEEYIPIAEARIKHWLDKMSKEQMELL